MKNTRMSTLVKKLGAPTASFKLNKDEYAKAIEEGRVLSIHSSDEEDGANFGQVGHNIVNVLNHVVFPKPIPSNVECVIGFNKVEYYG